MRPERDERLFQRIRRVRVIDHHHRIVIAPETLHAPLGAVHRGETHTGRGPVHPERVQHAEGSEEIRGVEGAGQRALQLERPFARGDTQQQSVRPRRDTLAHHRVRPAREQSAVAPARHGADAPRQSLQQRATEDIVGVDHGMRDAGQIEQGALRRAVLRHVAVIVEVIAREIGEDRDARLHAVETPLREPVRRGLHRHVPDAEIAEFREQGLQSHGVGRGVLRGPQFTGQAVPERADDRAGHARRQRLRDEMTGGGLAVRPRDGDDVQRARGMTMEARGDPARDAAQIRHGNQRHALA